LVIHNSHYNQEMEIELYPRQIGGSTVTPTASGWRLDMPAGGYQTYRLAQLDDYISLARSRFRHTPPWTFRLQARLSDASIPGTWGFGLWNDPFGFSIGFGGKKRRLPTLPQAAWFMHASPPNWLSFRDDPLPGSNRIVPASGFFAGTFRSPRIPALLFAPGLLALPFVALRSFSRLVRKLASRFIKQDGAGLQVEVTRWHEYSIQWLEAGCLFSVDGSEILRTPISPRPPLGLVIWIDNQFAAWTPEGRLGYGVLGNAAVWMEIEGLRFQYEQ
jgi:hypothetical protein